MVVEASMGSADPGAVEDALRQIGGESALEVSIRELDVETL